MHNDVMMGCFQMLETMMFKGRFIYLFSLLVNATSQSVLNPVCVPVCVWFVWFGKSRPQTRSSSRHVPPWLTENDMYAGFGKLDTYFMFSI